MQWPCFETRMARVRGLMIRQTLSREAPLLLALALVGSCLGGLLIGYEPVGGDPDRLYRPLKSELARALRDGRLPYWSHRLGLGIPLVAESHVAAFYPPNVVLYRVLDLSTAYRLSMWLHYVALVATTYFYARSLAIDRWGSAMAAVAFTLCGFQTIHSSHEPFYCVMPYLPLALAITERYAADGRFFWLTILALVLGAQWTLGHFQIQAWTGGLVILTGLWRALFDRRPWQRAGGIFAATIWGAAVAAVQLGLSWQYAATVGQTSRSVADFLYYSFPPAHWFEPALPSLIRGLMLGPDEPYWLGRQSSGYEAALYVGTIPLLLGFIGFFGRCTSRSTALWRVLLPLSLVLATMPAWWPEGYLRLRSVPVIGYFRVPARYTLLSSFGMALLAGEGFDRSLSTLRFRFGLLAGIFFGGLALAGGYAWSTRPDVHLRFSVFGIAGGALPAGLCWIVLPGLSWLVALIIVAFWRAGGERSWAPLVAAVVELGILFYTAQWGWSIELPGQSPVLSELARRAPSLLVGGELENLPVRAGLATAFPYLGYQHSYPNKILFLSQEWLLRVESVASPDSPGEAKMKRWFRRCGMTHLVSSRRWISRLGTELARLRDPALDAIAYRLPAEPAAREWSIVELDSPFPEARVARRARVTNDPRVLFDRLSYSDELDAAWFLAADDIPPRPDARAARLVSWNGTTATVEHHGSCDLVIARCYDPGWLARIDDGSLQQVLPVDDGLQAVRLGGSGTHRVRLAYRPPRLALWATISTAALSLIVGSWAVLLVAWVRRTKGHHESV
jgi:hypothetical protein